MVTKFTDLPAAVALSNADILASSQDISTTPISRKVTGTQVKAFISDQGLFAADNVTFNRVTATNNIVTDIINERSANNGVVADGVGLKDSNVSADVLEVLQINSKSPATTFEITATDGFLMPNGAGGAQTEFNHYENFTTFAPFMVPNPGFGSFTLTTSVIRVGDTVTLMIESADGPSITFSAATSFQGNTATAIPTRFRPTFEVCVPCIVRQSGTVQTTPGSMCMQTNGRLILLKNFTGSSSWGVGTTAGLRGMFMTWNIV